MKEWLANGGEATLASYSPFGDAGKLVDVPDEHWNFLENGCCDWYETESHFFVHANAYADMALTSSRNTCCFGSSSTTRCRISPARLWFADTRRRNQDDRRISDMQSVSIPGHMDKAG